MAVSECNKQLTPVFNEMQDKAFAKSLVPSESEEYAKLDGEIGRLYAEAERIFRRFHPHADGRPLSF